MNHDSLIDRISYLQSFALTEFGKDDAATVPSASAANPALATLPSGYSQLPGEDPISDDEALPEPETHKPHSDQETFAKMLNPSENILASALLNKPNPMGMSYKRQLIMTDAPRLFYLELKNNTVKGAVEWTADSPPTFKRVRAMLPVVLY